MYTGIGSYYPVESNLQYNSEQEYSVFPDVIQQGISDIRDTFSTPAGIYYLLQNTYRDDKGPVIGSPTYEVYYRQFVEQFNLLSDEQKVMVASVVIAGFIFGGYALKKRLDVMGFYE